jgi:tight adherence protein B
VPIAPHLALYGALLLTVIFLIEGSYFFLADLRGRRVRQTVDRRLSLLARAAGNRELPVHLRRRRPTATGPLGVLLRLPPVRAIDRMLVQSGRSFTVFQLLGALALCALTIYLTAKSMLLLAPPVAAIVALSAGVALPLAVLALLMRRRLSRFVQQLPDALEMIVRSLRAGHPVDASIRLVAREMPEPTGSQFGMVFDEVTYGLDLREALDNLGERMPCRELHFMIAAIRIQYGAGGNLAEILEVLSGVIRERDRMRRKILALSAEGRMSAWILAALPFLVFGAINLMNPSYYAGLFVDPPITWAMGGAFAALVGGIMILRRMVNLSI